MSAQTGIRATDDLLSVFNQSNAKSNPAARAIKASIRNESIVVADTLTPSGTWESDWNGIAGWLEDRIPCYVLYRLDAGNNGDGSASWILLQYVPDNSPVREKMLYAATKASFTKEIGDSWFVDSVYATSKSDLTLEAYKAHVASSKLAGPLTEAEKTLQKVKLEEARFDGVGTRRSNTASGISFPLTDEASKAVQELIAGSNDAIELKIENETIDISASPALSHSGIPSIIATEPRFVVFRFSHDWEGQKLAPTVFVYSCPPSSSVKHKMLYSSTKAGIVQTLEAAGVTIEKKLEVDSVDEMNASSLTDELHPQASSGAKQTFSKPRPPGRKR
ncbi:hypothetical protein M427DRAFT_51075 [Gonapodya prolifera JEL478]|uniref:Twinfilin n=1 Tax=Gonapodya prolifera (strain JEL478) TaxID=1344416 RepID=A0A139AYN6_GONPJ|nr:hypothetical protein M427DRAFT_51075 [Gonapodya prolifera JEL478]|eukprot:KXS21673.1 hypothetical protein M427DRAFT_51075 [Gonapodya prolifera JEL478]